MVGVPILRNSLQEWSYVIGMKGMINMEYNKVYVVVENTAPAEDEEEFTHVILGVFSSLDAAVGFIGEKEVWRTIDYDVYEHILDKPFISDNLMYDNLVYYKTWLGEHYYDNKAKCN